MSEVISFRLDQGNTREALAISVMRAWQSRGFSLRQIMAEALLKLDNNDKNQSPEYLSDLHQKLDEISAQIHAIGNSNNAVNKNGDSPEEGLSHQFMQSIKESAKLGLRSDDLVMCKKRA